MNRYINKHILFEDEDFVFIDKESGMLSVPDRYDQNKPNLKHILQQHYSEIYPLHRLDQFTSGIIVFAKNTESHKIGSELFLTRSITKKYIAICINQPHSESGRIETRIKESPIQRGTYMISDDGKEAITDFELIRKWQNYSMLDLQIYTGRTHQIRVHLASIGCPLLVDPQYGIQEHFFLSQLKRKKMNLKKGEIERPLLSRTPLHASELIFTQPNSSKEYNLSSPLPKDMKAIIYQLDKRFGAAEMDAEVEEN